jgi:hypothetical protein
LATEDELRTKPLLCHAVLIGEGDDRVRFVKKRSPVQLAKKSVAALLMNNTLDRVQSPIFAFDDRAHSRDDSICHSDEYAYSAGIFDHFFWASGCGTARMSNPGMRSKSSGLQVYSGSPSEIAVAAIRAS